MVTEYVLNWDELGEIFVEKIKNYFQFDPPIKNLKGKEEIYWAENSLPQIDGRFVLKKITIHTKFPSYVRLYVNNICILDKETRELEYNIKDIKPEMLEDPIELTFPYPIIISNIVDNMQLTVYGGKGPGKVGYFPADYRINIEIIRV